MTDDREAIIEAMAEAINEVLFHGNDWIDDPRDPKRIARAAYDASPLERYRLALENVQDRVKFQSSDYARDVWAIAERALRGEVAPVE